MDELRLNMQEYEERLAWKVSRARRMYMHLLASNVDDAYRKKARIAYRDAMHEYELFMMAAYGAPDNATLH